MQNAGKIKRSGTCGKNLQWTLYEDGQLVISGVGDMDDYSERKAPWYAEGGNITTLEILDGVTTIGARAFSGLSKLSKVVISDSIASISCIKSNSFKDALSCLSDPRCYVSAALEKSLGASQYSREPYAEELLYALYYTKMMDLFSYRLTEEGYQEPVYQKITTGYWDKEVPSPYVRRFYDENGVKRKQHIVQYKRLECANVFDERGTFIGSMSTNVSRSRPTFVIRIVTQINREQPRVVDYDLSIRDLTISPRAD